MLYVFIMKTENQDSLRNLVFCYKQLLSIFIIVVINVRQQRFIEIKVEVVRKLIPDFFAPISIKFTLLKFIWEL